MEKQTVFIKRYPSKGELPEYGQRVIGLVLEQNDLGLSKFLWNVSYHEEEKQFFLDGDIVPIGFWLQEVDLPTPKECIHPDVYLNSFQEGANFILNHLKSNTNESNN